MGDAGNQTSTTGQRVRTPIPGLYDSIDPNSRSRNGWKWVNRSIEIEPAVPPESDLTVIRRVDVEGPSGETGWFERAFNASVARLEMRNAFRGDLPEWIDATVPLVPGRGIPTTAFFTLYLMRKLGVGFGQVTLVKLSTIQNLKAIIELASFLRSGEQPDTAVLKTHSVKYSETALIQSGHEIVRATVEGGHDRDPVGDLMAYYEMNAKPAMRTKIREQHDRWLREHNFQRTDRMRWDYNVYLDVQPLAPGTVAQPLFGGP